MFWGRAESWWVCVVITENAQSHHRIEISQVLGAFTSWPAASLVLPGVMSSRSAESSQVLSHSLVQCKYYKHTTSPPPSTPVK